MTAHVQNAPAFAHALLNEAITLFVNVEPHSVNLILRDLVNATVGFETLADAMPTNCTGARAPSLRGTTCRAWLEEAAVHDDLRCDRLRLRLRLEQGRVGFGWLTARLRSRLWHDL